MPICKEFEELTPVEKANYLGSLGHSCQSDSIMYEYGKQLIEMATQRGLFEGVIIAPTSTDNNEPRNELN